MGNVLEKQTNSIEVAGSMKDNQNSEKELAKKIAQESIEEAKKVIGEKESPENLKTIIEEAVKDFTNLSQEYRKRADELKKKIDENYYKENKKELVTQMGQETNPETLIFLSNEFAKLEDEGYIAKYHADTLDSLADFFESSARYYGIDIAFDKMTDRKSLFPAALETALSAKYWKIKCNLFPEFPLSETRNKSCTLLNKFRDRDLKKFRDFRNF